LATSELPRGANAMRAGALDRSRLAEIRCRRALLAHLEVFMAAHPCFEAANATNDASAVSFQAPHGKQLDRSVRS